MAMRGTKSEIRNETGFTGPGRVQRSRKLRLRAEHGALPGGLPLATPRLDMLDSLAHRLALAAEDLLDRAKRLLPADERAAVLAPYRAYGTPSIFRLLTRVLRDPGDLNADAGQSAFDNLRDMFARFESDEIPGVLVEATFGEATAQGISDEEGYAAIHLDPAPLDRTASGTRSRCAPIP